jgi:exodeoxyribonuclease VII small subunit
MPTFEEQLKTLETVVEKLERGDLPLEESLSLFEQGVTLSEACKKELEAAEGRVQVLLQRGNSRERIAEDLVLEED